MTRYLVPPQLQTCESDTTDPNISVNTGPFEILPGQAHWGGGRLQNETLRVSIAQKLARRAGLT